MKDALGRGFSDLIPENLFDDEFDPTATEDSAVSTLADLSLSDVMPDPDQPRKHIDEESLTLLAESIKSSGVLQPIVVTKTASGKYLIVAGERRYRASLIAGQKTIPAIIRTIDDQRRLELSVIENAQREDLAPLELATAYAKLQSQFNLSTKDIAKKIGKNKITIENTMRLLKLPDFAKEAMIKCHLTESIMRPLVSADEKLIEKILPKIIDGTYNSHMVELAVKSEKPKSSEAAIKTRQSSATELSLMHRLKTFNPTRVQIKSRSLTFSFKSEKDLKSFLETLK